MSSARTTVVRPADPSLHAALQLAFVFGAIKLALHVAANLWESHIGYGYFRDEMYYLICGRHLAWGYVDHGPLVALQARISETFFGRSLAGLRFLSALAGATRVFLTGILAWAMGGRRPAQGLAMLGVVLAPQYLGIDSYLSMNSFESVFWMLCLLALILLLRGAWEVTSANSLRLWLLFGASAGIGLLNKPSMVFFLVALLAALLLTPQRRLLATRWAAVGVLVLIAIALPNLIWQISHHWPTLEFLENGRRGHKSIALDPLAFTLKQILNMGPFLVFIWGAGLVHLLRRRGLRWLGLTFVLFFLLMVAMQAKDYYVSPIYPILFAAGGIAWETRFSARRLVASNHAFAFPIYETIAIAGAIFILPLSLPLMPPAHWIAYTRSTQLYRFNGNSERNGSGPLPQFYADRFGWQEEVDQVTRIYNTLPPDQKKITGILCSNYGEASALNFLGHSLPFAISAHNNYYLWGPRGYTFDSMILIEDSTPEHLHHFFNSVQIAGRMGTTYSMPYEHRNIYLVRGRKFDPAALWREKKDFF